MSRPGFIENAVLGLGLAVAGAATLTALPPLLGSTITLKLVITGLAAASMVHLLYRSPERTGRLVIPCLWVLATTAAWALVEVSGFALSQVLLLSLVRALYFHAGALSALADLILAGLATAAALWALGTGSWLLALWSYFLVQALFTWIPSARPDGNIGGRDDDGFAEAHDLARSALERLATGR